MNQSTRSENRPSLATGVLKGIAHACCVVSGLLFLLLSLGMTQVALGDDYFLEWKVIPIVLLLVNLVYLTVSIRLLITDRTTVRKPWSWWAQLVAFAFIWCVNIAIASLFAD
jgi:hypothetical protein